MLGGHGFSSHEAFEYTHTQDQLMHCAVAFFKTLDGIFNLRWTRINRGGMKWKIPMQKNVELEMTDPCFLWLVLVRLALQFSSGTGWQMPNIHHVRKSWPGKSMIIHIFLIRAINKQGISNHSNQIRFRTYSVHLAWRGLVGSIPVIDILACDLGQVTLLRMPHPLNGFRTYSVHLLWRGLVGSMPVIDILA
jgi:hypothetical protein